MTIIMQAWKYFGEYFDERGITYLNFNTQYFKAFSHDLKDYTDYDGHMNGNAAKEYSKVLANILKGGGCMINKYFGIS